jgi:hypothetical protein
MNTFIIARHFILLKRHLNAGKEKEKEKGKGKTHILYIELKEPALYFPYTSVTF